MADRLDDFEVAIDARWLHTGLGTYTYNILSRLKVLKPSWRLRVLTNLKSAAQIAGLCDSVRILGASIYTLREQWQVPFAARGATLLHVPHYNVPLLHRGKLVVTIHDLIHLMDDRKNVGTSVRAYATIMLKAAARKADHIITVSQFSKLQIVERLAVDPSRVSVIPNGVANHFYPTERGEDPDIEAGILEEPYFLYVGNLKPHKNLMRLLSAIALCRMRRKLSWKLLIVGPEDESGFKQLQIHAARLGISDCVCYRTNVAPDLLPAVYRKAKFLVLPSLLEGFGLPVAEAMACGTPVVCSYAASLPEVAGDAARYFNPMDVEDMASALEAVASSEELRGTLRASGFEQASLFSWNESAKQHVNVFDKVLCESSD